MIHVTVDFEFPFLRSIFYMEDPELEKTVKF